MLFPVTNLERETQVPVKVDGTNRRSCTGLACVATEVQRGKDKGGRGATLPPRLRGNQLPAPCLDRSIFTMTFPTSGLRSTCPLVVGLLACGLAFPVHAAETNAKATRGATLYAGCIQCHGEKAEGI